MATDNSLKLKNSRLVQGGTTEIGEVGLEWWDRKIYNSDPTDRVYAVENFYEGRLDLIALAFYQEPRWWWFIAQYNHILDPITEIVAGRILYIPTKDRMQRFMIEKPGGVSSTRENQKILPPIIV